MIVHVLRHSFPTCAFTTAQPIDWPPGHSYVSELDGLHRANCAPCLVAVVTGGGPRIDGCAFCRRPAKDHEARLQSAAGIVREIVRADDAMRAGRTLPVDPVEVRACMDRYDRALERARALVDHLRVPKADPNTGRPRPRPSPSPPSAP